MKKKTPHNRFPAGSPEALQLEARAQVVMQEFWDHVAECRTLQMTDERKIFEGWAIQKIANLQMMVARLTWRLDQIAGVHDDTDPHDSVNQAVAAFAEGKAIG
jgi:hypothetical protein